MRNKTKLITILALIIISVIGLSAYLFQGTGKQQEELTPVLPETSEVVVIGRVLDTSPSLQGIHIIRDSDEEREIFTVVLTDETQLISASGSQINLNDLQPGMRIRAIGKPGFKKDGMLAREVRILAE
jgi:hypothetical protein